DGGDRAGKERDDRERETGQGHAVCTRVRAESRSAKRNCCLVGLSVKDEGLVPGAWWKTFILHPSCFILWFLARARPAPRRPRSIAQCRRQRRRTADAVERRAVPLHLAVLRQHAEERFDDLRHVR